MARGDKTKAAGAVAMASFGTAFFDFTGASAVTCLASGTGFAIGSTYHATRGSIKLIKEGMAHNRERKAAANTFGIPPAVHVDMQETIENRTWSFKSLRSKLMLITSLMQTPAASQPLYLGAQSKGYCSS